MTLQQWFTGPEKWCKGSSGKTPSGRSVAFWEDELENCTRYCLLGAIYRFYPADESKDIAYKIYVHLDGVGVSTWNDRFDRTFEDIQHLVKELNV